MKIKLHGREGVLVFLAVAVFVGLAIGTGALDFGSLFRRAIPAPKVTAAQAAAQAASVAGAAHG